MKLQLVAEDISSALEDQSLAGLRRIPRAVAEIDRVELDATRLRGKIEGILRCLDDVERPSLETVRLLSSVDDVKARMTEARDAVRHAAGFAELVRSCDDVFAAGNVRHMADVLSSMRRGLEIVGGVPEFAGAPEKVAELEKKMERAARPELVDALEKSDATRAEETRDVLRVAGVPTAALEETYAEVRVITPLMREWRAFDDIVEQNVETSDAKSLVKAERFAAWLPGYFERVASTLAGEARFATRAFGEEGGALVAHAWIALSEKTKRSFSARMASGRVASFVSVSSAAGEGAARAARGVADAAGARLAGAALVASLTPFDAVRERYGELEGKQLAEDVGALLLALENGVSGDVEGFVRDALATIARASAAFEAPLARCEALTAGVEAPAMLDAVDAAFARFAAGIETLVDEKLRAKVLNRGGKLSDEDAGEATISSISVVGEEGIRAALELLRVSDAATSLLVRTEARHLDALRRLSKREREREGSDGLEPSSAEDLVPELAARANAPDAKRRALRETLERFAPGGGGSGSAAAAEKAAASPFPAAREGAAALTRATRRFALDAALSTVRREFAALASSRGAWHRRAPEGEAAEKYAADLPSFGAHPQARMTNAGEYLLSLPQLLEAIAEAREEESLSLSLAQEEEGGVPEGGGSSGSIDAGEWMADVAEAAAGLLLAHARGVEALAEPGAAQMGADVEYFINVVAALSLEPPPQLVAYAACCAAPRDSYAIIAKDEGVDQDVARAVARMRNIRIE